MRNGILALSCAAALAAGCATTDVRPDAIATVPSTVAVNSVAPYDAIQRAAAAAPEGTPGPFVITVQATGSQGRHVYLNSELDYRDQRNLTVALPPAVARNLGLALGADPQTALMGKTLLVQGEAKRTRIHFLANGRPTGGYYYQTHVTLRDAGQISVVEDN